VEDKTMINLQSLKRKGLLLALAATISASAFAQASSAISLSPDQDLSVAISSGYSAVDTGTHELLVKHISVGDKLVSLLKFNTSSLKGKSITGANLNLTGYGLLKPGDTSVPINLYYVANDSFVDESVNIPFFPLSSMYSLIGGVGASPISTQNVSSDQQYTFSFNASGLSQLISDVGTSGDNYISFLLRTPLDDGNADFSSRHDLNFSRTPLLNVDVAPVPEPSSMLMGIMGLSSLLGIRKRKGEQQTSMSMA
jgi:hypothetical protein